MDMDSALKGKRMVSRNALGENHAMTIVINTITYIQNQLSRTGSPFEDHRQVLLLQLLHSQPRFLQKLWHDHR